MEGRQLFAVIQTLCNQLFDAEERRINDVLTKIWEQNQTLQSRMDGFFYKGTFYRPFAPVSAPTKGPLHPELHQQMEAFLADKQIVMDDRKLIEQTLTKLLRPCKDFTDIRNALPNCMAPILEQYVSAERTNEEAWTLVGDDAAMRRYLKVRPKLEFYSTARLLY